MSFVGCKDISVELCIVVKTEKVVDKRPQLWQKYLYDLAQTHTSFRLCNLNTYLVTFEIFGIVAGLSNSKVSNLESMQ